MWNMWANAQVLIIPEVEQYITPSITVRCPIHYSNRTVTASNLITIPLQPSIASTDPTPNTLFNPLTYLKKRNAPGIINLNIRSLLQKLNPVNIFILQTDPDVLVLSETWLKKSVKDLDVALKDYSFIE